MSTIVSPEQQWKSLGINGLDRRNEERSNRPQTEDARWTADPWDAHAVPAGRRSTEEFPQPAELYRPSALPARVQPASVNRGRVQHVAEAAEATGPASRYRVVDQGRFWVGSVLTSGVAALAGVTGLVIAQDLLKVPVPLASIGLAGAHVGTYGMVAALVALLAALAYDGMLAFAPRPAIYYGWLTGLLVALAVLLPFAAPVALYSQLALALVNLVVGVAIMVLVPVAASSARTR